MEERNQPRTIDVERGDAITITFVDDEVARFELVTLRRGCPCAACRLLRSQGAVVWPRPGVPTPLRVERAELHGGWGLSISWNDGHSTGIFPFESLRQCHDGGPAFPEDSGLGGAAP